MNCPKCDSKKNVFLSDVAWQIPWEMHKDEKGKLHKHDPNKHFTDYKCECGYTFEEFYFPTCACGWQAENR